jgi:acyl carrier protein
MTTTVTQDQIVSTLTGIVATELGVPAADVRPDTDLRALEGADSVKVLRVVAKIEREYDVELEDEDVFAVSSVGEVAGVVHRALDQELV